MAAEWYYAKGKEKVGPLTTAQLRELARSGELSRNDMVWKQGMANWTPAAQVKHLFAEVVPQVVPASVPPPLPDDREPAPALGSGLVLPWPAEERNGFSVVQWVGLGASGFLGLLGLVFVVVSLADGGQGLCCGPLVFCVVGLVLTFAVFNGFLIHGRWVPADGEGGWVELLGGGVFKQEDGLVGTYVLTRNKKFIDIRVASRLVDSWKILSWGTSSLEIQDSTGKARSFTKGKTLEEKRANPFHRDRTDHLPRTWEPIDGSNEWVQFTKDGAVVFADGGAGKYAVSGEEPNEVITLRMSDGTSRQLRVLSLSRSQLVVQEGGAARTYRNAEGGGGSVGGASGAVGPVQGGKLLSGFWNWLSGKEPCVYCKSRNTKVEGTKIIKQWQEVGTDYLESTPGNTKQAVFNCSLYEEQYHCNDCGMGWIYERKGRGRA